MRKLIGLSLFGAVLLLGLCGWMFWQISAQHQPAQAVELEIPKGASTIKIGRLLQEQGVITSKLAFRIAARLHGVSAGLQSGLYRFEEPASIKVIIERLERGDVMRFQVTVPEGLRNDEIIALLASKTGIKGEVWQAELNKLLPESPDGRLLPETYQYTKPLNPAELLSSMIKAQQVVLNALSSDPAVQERLRIAASIIEKETMLDHERPLVSAVIRNRLVKRMPLQMDPTVIYGIWKTTGTFSGDIRKRDLSADTPWNTYTRRGLPPTPIGNPGAASLKAAAAPADVDYLFFVADGTGGHKFAATHEGHLANVEQWIRIERQKNRSDSKK
ncbi:endolytic transglycosylase MltG [Mariprofundus sp. KV]|uniref:endolytic transglycosylase MltG n=1 Tax=Mariprofundus sp. KV TaxID=2608715 RepID=UPI00159FA2BB|nr:endolytic transglycosylase MltG [Mariprofundus sp. KV]NWF35703.1 endolytic transglycosylase MltG [Mariprofundus sp. KV]